MRTHERTLKEKEFIVQAIMEENQKLKKDAQRLADRVSEMSLNASKADKALSLLKISSANPVAKKAKLDVMSNHESQNHVVFNKHIVKHMLKEIDIEEETADMHNLEDSGIYGKQADQASNQNESFDD